MRKMMIVEQGSDSWLNLRKKYITASEMPILMGISPHETPLGLMKKKMFDEGEDGNKKYIFKRGHLTEDAINKMLKSDMPDMNFKPAVITNTTYPELLASLDGYDAKSNTVLEVKLVDAESIRNFQVKAYREDHIAQIQTQLLVTESPECKYIVVSNDGEAYMATVKADKKIQHLIIQKGAQAYKDMKAGILPPPCERDYIEIDDPSFKLLADLKDDRDRAVKAFDNLKAKTLARYEDIKNIRAGGLRINRITKKGSVDYKLVPELMGVDLEKYRKKPSVSWSVNWDSKKEKL